MKLVREFRKSFNRKLITIFLFILILATSLIGISSYQITQKALAEKGKVVLKNSVVQALDLIHSEYEKVQAGLISKADAQETIKTILTGPMGADGTRQLHKHIDLSYHGYFIIYDKTGVEMLHPTLEGQNVWDVTDMNDSEHYIVREQIQTALNGGGYTYYAWRFPYSDKIGKKISYAAFSPAWEWIVCSTAYELDFVNEATEILYTIVLVTVILVVFTGYAGTIYIKSATKPVLDIARGMKHVTQGRYQAIHPGNYNDVSINISPLCFMEKDFAGKIERALKKHKIPPHRLILEITEDIFIADYKEINKIIARLRQLFVKVSIDDFGTGYSSLNYLRNIHPDEIKLDKSFVDQILDDDKAFYMFETLCNIAENFGYSIVAEGVETREQLEKISTTPLKIIQGYLFSKPEPLSTPAPLPMKTPSAQSPGSCS